MPGISGYQIVDASKTVAANTTTAISVNCPAGTRVLGASAYWSSSNAAVQTVISAGATLASGYTNGIAGADTLNVRAVCAVVQ